MKRRLLPTRRNEGARPGDADIDEDVKEQSRGEVVGEGRSIEQEYEKGGEGLVEDLEGDRPLEAEYSLSK